MAKDRIIIKGAKAHNLKNIDLELPRDKFIVFTGLSGSGPAYVFYFLEAMQRAGEHLGLTGEQARQLAIATFEGSAKLAQQATEKGDTLAALRERVTSKGGTTQAALDVLRAAKVADHFERAMHAAHTRAQELGRAAAQ